MLGTRSRRRGQSVAEFALVLPVLIAIIGGIIQFGLIFWAQNTLTQVVRDTGRWAATQQTSPCNTGTVPAGQQFAGSTGVRAVLGEANLVASNSSLLGYPPATPWTATDETTTGYTSAGDDAVKIFTGGVGGEGVAVAWVADNANGETCPPNNNQAVYHVTIKIVHTVPVFFPGMQYLPGFADNKITLSSTAQFRMEPEPTS